MFGNNNKIFVLYKILPFKMSKQHCFPKIWPLIFDLLTLLLHFMLDPDPNPIPEPDLQHCLYTNLDIEVFMGFMHGVAYSRCEP
jgi:hypothetical protein